MSFLNPNYPTMEVAISLVDYAPLASGHERVLAGDIIAVRKPDTGIGTKELEDFLWLRLEGLEEDEFSKLTDNISDSTSNIIYDKRRYCIPLERLLELDSTFDIDLTLQAGSKYQPYLFVDYELDYSFVLENPLQPFEVSGLVYDKVIGDYL